MSSSDIKENAAILAENPSAVAHVSHQTFKQIKENKDDVFDAATVGTFIDARKSHFASLTGDALKREIQITKPADLAEHDITFFKRAEVVQNLDPQTLTGMVRTGLSQEKREAMRVAVESEFAALPKATEATEASKTLDKQGNPITPAKPAVTPPYTPEQQNIVKLHDWFNNNNRMNV